MKHYLLAVPFLAMSALLSAEEFDCDEGYVIQDEACDEDVCLPPEESRYSRRYYCPHRYSNYYDYNIPDNEASWPGKNDYSFMEELMR